MKKLAIILLLASCSPKAVSQYDRVRQEAKKFNRKQLPPPQEYRVYTIAACMVVSIILQHGSIDH